MRPFSALNRGFSSVSRRAGGGVRQRRKSLQGGGNATRCRRKTDSSASTCGETRVGWRPSSIPLSVVSGATLGHSARKIIFSPASVTVPRIMVSSVRTRVVGLAQGVSKGLEVSVGPGSGWSKQSTSNSVNSV